jgi:hypothetical protein
MVSGVFDADREADAKVSDRRSREQVTTISTTSRRYIIDSLSSCLSRPPLFLPVFRPCLNWAKTCQVSPQTDQGQHSTMSESIQQIPRIPEDDDQSGTKPSGIVSEGEEEVCPRFGQPVLLAEATYLSPQGRDVSLPGHVTAFVHRTLANLPMDRGGRVQGLLRVLVPARIGDVSPRTTIGVSS